MARSKFHNLLPVTNSSSGYFSIPLQNGRAVSHRLQGINEQKPIQQFSTRPAVNAEANIEMIVEECRGSATERERMHLVADCLSFVANREDLYMRNVSSQESAKRIHDLSVTISSHGKIENECPGPTFLYHTYWHGPMIWRVELFIKSYLQTQNLACSQLWIWVDSNDNAKAMDEFLTHPRFKQFIPLLAIQQLLLKPWYLPDKIPLPPNLDHRDGRGHSKRPDPRFDNMIIVADRIYLDKEGQEWLAIYQQNKLVLSPVTLSDIFRFMVLHLHGGLYLDMDIMLLRDMRPLLTPGKPFAERWGQYEGLGEINTAVLFLIANSSLSSYLLRTGARLDLNYHPRVIGDIARRDDRIKDLVVFETATFDPVWGEFDGGRQGRCAVPCFRNFEDFFTESIEGEWEGFGDEHHEDGKVTRSLDKFFAGAYAYHIHNLWSLLPEPGSWLDLFIRDQDSFFKHQSSSRYGEMWTGPSLDEYALGS